MRRLAGSHAGPVVTLLVALAFGGYTLASLSLGRATQPGPGLWPLIVSVAVAVMSLVLLVTRSDSGDYEAFSGRIRVVGLAVAVTACFIVAFATLGFTIPGFALLVVWLRFFGKESWRLTLTVAALATVAFDAVFVFLLAVPFPDDILFFLLPG